MYQPSNDAELKKIGYLGRGGTAEVVGSFHRVLNRRVAVKYALPHPQDNSVDFAALARREYELIGRHRFPGLVRLLRDPAPDYDHLILELCKGETLDQLGRVDDLSLALNLISALAIDLEFLNAVGLVHGDLKPQNVFLPEDLSPLAGGRLSYLKLSDFSMGRRRQEHDRYRIGLGTVGYMAPETITDAVATHRSDLFALGIIAYQLITGRHPFMDDTSDPLEVNSRIREISPPPVRRIRPDISEAVGNTVDQLLARDPADRPSGALEVCQALESAGATYPFRKALRPAHLLQISESYDNNVATWLEIDAPNRRRLDTLCEDSASALRLILNHNLRREHLEYVEGKYRFSGPVLWPVRLRNREIRLFARMSFGARRTAVREAVLSNAQYHGETDGQGKPTNISPALAELLPCLLRTETIKRIAARLAKEKELQDSARPAAELYLTAGSLGDAERCAYQAGEELKRDLKYASAQSLLAKVIEFGEMSGRRWEVRQLVMLRGDIHKESGEIEQARETYAQLIDWYGDSPKDKLLALAYKALGDTHRIRQDTDASLVALAESLAVFEELGDELEISHTRTNMGNVHWLHCDYPAALRNYRAALTIQKRLGAAADYASTLHNIATVYGISGRVRRGLFLLQESLKRKKEIGHLGEIARTLNNLGYVYQISGRPAIAAEHLAESLEINRRIGSKKELVYNLENLAELTISAGRLRESMSLLREGIQLSSENGYARHLGALQIHTATVQKRMGQYGEADQSLFLATPSMAEIEDKPLEVAWKVQQASLCYHLGKTSAALELASAALDEARAAKDTVGMTNCLLLKTRLSDDGADYDETVGLIEEQHLKRERIILDFGRLEYLIENDKPEEASDLANCLLNLTVEEEQDIEMPWMLNLSSEMMLRQRENRKASAYLERSSRLASSTGLIPELIVALTLQGKMAHSEGNFEGCFATYRKALQLCKKTSDNIRVLEDRTFYQSKRIVGFLAREIKLLSQRLGEKQRAG
ncbi:MAG: serine/threonine protein kinase [bacterium]|nr:serine/threonine protein kinase [bacterium]